MGKTRTPPMDILTVSSRIGISATLKKLGK